VHFNQISVIRFIQLRNLGSREGRKGCETRAISFAKHILSLGFMFWISSLELRTNKFFCFTVFISMKNAGIFLKIKKLNLFKNN
jgi:hypothetical protein